MQVQESKKQFTLQSCAFFSTTNVMLYKKTAVKYYVNNYLDKKGGAAIKDH